MRDRSAGFGLLLFALVLAGLVTSLPAGAADDSRTGTDGAVQNADGKVVAYYFHGNFRCGTCRTIEAYAQEAVTKAFAEEIASGRLAWRVVNVDEPESKHFVQDFELVSKSLVLAAYRDGKVARYQNLEKVWQLVRDKEGFLDYVRTSTREFLGGR